MCPFMPVIPVLWKLRQGDYLGHGVRLQWDHFSVKLRNKVKQQQQQQQNQENQIGARDEGNDTFRELREGNCPPRVAFPVNLLFQKTAAVAQANSSTQRQKESHGLSPSGDSERRLVLKKQTQTTDNFNKYKLIFYQEALTKGISKSHTAGRQTRSEDANMRWVDKTEAPPSLVRFVCWDPL